MQLSGGFGYERKMRGSLVNSAHWMMPEEEQLVTRIFEIAMREIVGRTPSDEIRTGGRQVAQDQREAASAAVVLRESLEAIKRLARIERTSNEHLKNSWFWLRWSLPEFRVLSLHSNGRRMTYMPIDRSAKSRSGGQALAKWTFKRFSTTSLTNSVRRSVHAAQ